MSARSPKAARPRRPSSSGSRRIPQAISPAAGLRRRLHDGLIALVGAVVIVSLATRFVATPFRVDQTSMSPSLEPGDHLIVDRLSGSLLGYQHGDIVVFTPPPSWGAVDNVAYVKRIIGLPGDEILIVDGSVIRNGLLLEETYVDFGTMTESIGGPAQIFVGADELFVMGDHRAVSDDSRRHGAIPTSSVIGRVALRYLPLDRAALLTAP